MNPTLPTSLAAIIAPPQALPESVPSALEAMVLGLLLASYVGVWCALVFGERLGRTIGRVRRRVRAPRAAAISPAERARREPADLDWHFDELHRALAAPSSPAWGEEIRRYQRELRRLQERLD